MQSTAVYKISHSWIWKSKAVIQILMKALRNYKLRSYFSSEFVEYREKPKQDVEINEVKENQILVVEMLLSC